MRDRAQHGYNTTNIQKHTVACIFNGINNKKFHSKTSCKLCGIFTLMTSEDNTNYGETFNPR